MAETTTPSGLHIEFNEQKHSYTVNGQAVPTVTQVLRILDKPALVWWGMKTGLEGFCEMTKRYNWRQEGFPDFDADDLVKWLTREKLTTNHVRNKAGDRGKYVHQALEQLHEGTTPDPRAFPTEGRGYVAAVIGWWDENVTKSYDSEVLVASLEYGFAGTFDLFCELTDGRLARVDAKTSKRIYPDMFLQLEAYEYAAEESGYPESDVRIVLRVAADGTWEAQESYATADQFLAILGAHKAMQDLKQTKAAA